MIQETKWLREYWETRIEEGNYCVIYEQEQWDGFGNNLNLLIYMEEKGWEFIHASKDVIPYSMFNKEMLAKRTAIELVFRRIKQ